MCTKMLLGDVHRCCIDVQRCFGHDWVQLGHMTTMRVVCIQNPKWLLANFSFSYLSSQIWDFVTKYAISVSNSVF